MEKVLDKTERDFLVALEMHDFRRRLMQYLIGGIEIRRKGGRFPDETTGDRRRRGKNREW